MTLQEFDKVLASNEELKDKFNQRVAALLEQVKTEEEAPEKLSALITELGYDVPAEEFVIKKLLNKELDSEELEKVAGGAKGWCVAMTTCYTALVHRDDEDESDACWKNWQCMFINK